MDCTKWNYVRLGVRRLGGVSELDTNVLALPLLQLSSHAHLVSKRHVTGGGPGERQVQTCFLL